MRFFIYWLIRGGMTAFIGLAVLILVSAFLDDIAFKMASNPDDLKKLANGPAEEARVIFRNIMLNGVASGLMVAAAALIAWRVSDKMASRWTNVVQTGTGDAVVHPAVLHIEALSPEEREKWLSTYPDKSNYGFTVLGLLILSGLLVAFGISATFRVPAVATLIAYMWGLFSLHEIAVFGGSLNRRILRWTGYPGEALVRQMFERDAGLRK